MVEIYYKQTSGKYDDFIIDRLHQNMLEDGITDIYEFLNEYFYYDRLKFYPIESNKTLITNDEEVRRVVKQFIRKEKIEKIISKISA